MDDHSGAQGSWSKFRKFVGGALRGAAPASTAPADPKADLVSRRLTAVGQAVLANANYQGDWRSLAVVADMEGEPSLFGYLYLAEGGGRAEIPADAAGLFDKVAALRQAMTEKDGHVWKACVITIMQPDLKFGTRFEYDDAERWRITPSNMAEKVEEIRPR